jgi:hypothetical protein
MGGVVEEPLPASPPLVNQRSSWLPFKCSSCLEEFSECLHLQCKTDLSHCLCLPCSAQYTSHALEQASFGDSKMIPLKCFIPDCPYVFPDHKIATILPTAEKVESQFNGLWEKYQRQLVFHAIQNPDSKEDALGESMISCPKCGVYAEVYHPPEQGFFSWVERRMRLEAESFEDNIRARYGQMRAEIDREFHRAAAEIQEEADRESSAIQFQQNKMIEDELESRWSKERQRIMDENLTSLRFNNAKDQELTLLRSKLPSSLNNGEKLSLSALHQSKSLSSHLENKKKALHHTYELSKYLAMMDFPEMTNYEKTLLKRIDTESLLFRNKYRDQISIVAIAKHKPLFDKVQETSTKRLSEAEMSYQKNIMKQEREFSQKIKAEKEQLLSHDHWKRTADSLRDKSSKPLKVESKVKVPSNETSKYFLCGVKECSGALCLCCNIPLEKKKIALHQCKENPVDILYAQVLDTLARAAARECPECHFPGMKDLACTHMHCERCRTRWCYHCGVAEYKLPGGFPEHNNWTIPEDGNGQCPMYLHYKYGDIEGNERRDGDPAVALRKFHLVLQRAAMEKLQKETDPNLWAEMEKTRFPNGIFS